MQQYGGDPIKFCGDAILCTWSASSESSQAAKESIVRRAAACGLQLLECFRVKDTPQSSQDKVSLSLHCGLSVGTMHCMCLGSEQRMEWVISGPLLRDMGSAAAEAQAGQFCVADSVIDYLEHSTSEETPMGNHRLTSLSQKTIQHPPSSPKGVLSHRPTFPSPESSSSLSPLSRIFFALIILSKTIPEGEDEKRAKSVKSVFRIIS